MTIAIIIFDINTIFAIIINFIIITISSSKIIAISTLTTIIRSRDGARNLSYILDCLTTLGCNEPSRCDQTSNCLDESDEDNCRLLSMKVGHLYINVAHSLYCPFSCLSYLLFFSLVTRVTTTKRLRPSALTRSTTETSQSTSMSQCR